jgi:hypothetical protein
MVRWPVQIGCIHKTSKNDDMGIKLFLGNGDVVSGLHVSIESLCRRDRQRTLKKRESLPQGNCWLLVDGV